MVMKRKTYVMLIVVAMVIVTAISSCYPHKWFIVNSEGILSYDRNKGTFELLWHNKSAGHAAGSGTVKVDSILFSR